MLYEEHDVNRNVRDKDAEKITFHTKRYIQCRYEKSAVHHQCQRMEVRASLSGAEIHFLKCESCCKMNGATTTRRCLNRSGYIWKYLKIRDKEYLLY